MTDHEPTRQDMTFDVDGTPCAAWFHAPAGPGPKPVIVMAHGFGGTRRLRLDAYAERFAAAGYAVLLFDYRSFGDSGGEPRRVLSIRRQLADWRAAIADARTRPGVDPDRVVLWGSSLSGGHVLTLAGQGTKAAAVVAQVPHVSGIRAALAVGPVMSARLGLRAARDIAGSLLRRPPHYVLAFARPGQVAAMTSEDAYDGVQRMLEQSGPMPAEFDVAARIIAMMPLYSPGRRTRRITAPTLVQVGLRDAIAPPGPTIRAADRIRNGSLLRYDLNHFDPYVTPHFDRVVTDQLDFLHRTVPAE